MLTCSSQSDILTTLLPKLELARADGDVVLCVSNIINKLAKVENEVKALKSVSHGSSPSVDVVRISTAVQTTPDEPTPPSKINVQLETKVTQLAHENQQLKQIITQLRNKVNDREEEVRLAEQEKSRLSAEISKLKTQLFGLEVHISQTRELETEKDELLHSVKAQQVELNELRMRESSERDLHVTEQHSFEEHIRQLSEDLLSCRQSLDESLAERKSALADLRLAQLDSARAQQSSSNLQRVLEQFERDKQREIIEVQAANASKIEAMSTEHAEEVSAERYSGILSQFNAAGSLEAPKY